MQVIAIFMLLMGVGIGSIWTRDIVSAKLLDISHGRLRAREPESGSLMLPHWIAEYGTAAALVAGAVGLLSSRDWAEPLSFVALGALVYTSANSLGWALAQRSRLSYGVPMAVGLVGGLVAVIGLWAH